MKINKMNLQIIAAITSLLLGFILLFIGIFCPPIGVIDSSVLIAFGEAGTFAGSCLGIDYNYKYKIQMLHNLEPPKDSE
jgi:E3 ubiquitin-protein ligase DOA10